MIFTDTSGSTGYAGILGKEWCALRWDSVPDSDQFQIAIKELFPIVLALEIWGKSLENKEILFLSDNEVVVHVINKQTFKQNSYETCSSPGTYFPNP